MAASSQQSSGQKGGGRFSGLSREFKEPERRTAYYMVVPTLAVIVTIAFYPVPPSPPGRTRRRRWHTGRSQKLRRHVPRQRFSGSHPQYNHLFVINISI